MRERAEGRTMTEQSSRCPLCEGSGFKMFDGEDAKGGSIKKATRCNCQLRARGERLTSAARIPKRYEHCELSNFEFDGPHQSLARPRLAACRFVGEDSPARENAGLLLIGTIGTGKTHLAVGIIKELILSKGIGCLFYDYRELLKQIQNSYNSSVQATELQVLRPVFETEVL